MAGFYTYNYHTTHFDHREMKTYFHTKTCTQIFTTALFVNNPDYLSMGQWLNCDTSIPWTTIQQQKETNYYTKLCTSQQKYGE